MYFAEGGLATEALQSASRQRQTFHNQRHRQTTFVFRCRFSLRHHRDVAGGEPFAAKSCDSLAPLNVADRKHVLRLDGDTVRQRYTAPAARPCADFAPTRGPWLRATQRHTLTQTSIDLLALLDHPGTASLVRSLPITATDELSHTTQRRYAGAQATRDSIHGTSSISGRRR
jgi:hypothetical protein